LACAVLLRTSVDALPDARVAASLVFVQDAPAFVRETPNAGITGLHALQCGRSGRREVPHHCDASRCAENLPEVGTMTSTELSPSAVKAFCDDAVVEGLSLEISGNARAAISAFLGLRPAVTL
jgi:hypothetical protein